MAKKITKIYRKAFGHKSPYRRTYGSRTAGQAIGVTYRQGLGVAQDVAKIAKDLAQLKKRQNVEKNYVDSDLITTSIGQVDASLDGATAVDVTPLISQGDGQGNRHGNSLKITGLSFPMSFIGMRDTHSARKIRVSLMRVRDNNNNTTAPELIAQYWDVNPLNGVRDTNAPRNYRSSKHDGITCIRSKTYMLKPTHQNFSSATDVREQSHFTAKFNVSLQDVFRYTSNVDTFPDGLRYFLVFQCDSGNSDSATGSVLNVPIGNPNTGVNIRVSQRSWYVDN